MSDEELFDPEFLQRLRTLFFKLRRRKKLKRKGLQQTHAVGFTREFKDHRPYTSKDDFRTIDWRLFARLEKLFVRLYEEIQEYHIHILLDRSASMLQPYSAKRVLALRLTVGLAYLALMSQHRVSLLSFSDDVRQEFPPLKGQGHVHEILKHLGGLEFTGLTDLSTSLKRFRPSRGRRGIVFILSDLLSSEPADTERALLQAATWNAETHVVHILHRDEVRPKLDGEVRLVDVESGEKRRLNLSRMELARYTQAVEEYLEQLEHACRRRQIDYVTWYTDQPFEQLFLSLLSRGSALTHK